MLRIDAVTPRRRDAGKAGVELFLRSFGVLSTRN